MPYFHYYNPEEEGAVYLFDTYAGAVGYSLRQLKTGVTNCIRVRRSSDNTEQDIGFSGGDLDTTTLASFCSGTSGYVVTWYDQSGNGYDITQSSSSLQPRIVSSGTIDTKGGLPAVYFASDELERSALSLFDSGNAYSFYSVSAAGSGSTVGAIFTTNPTGVPSSSRLAHFCDARTTPNRNLIIQNTTPTDYFANLSAARNNTNQRYLSCFVTSGKAMSAFDNGATGGTATYTGSYYNNGFMVGRQQSSTLYLTGYIQEILIYSSDTSSNRTSIEGDITSYYGL